MQLFPEKVRKLWNGWEIRVLILLSLLLQIILIIFGSKRKYTKGIKIRIIVWSAYIAADWVAAVALGNLASNQGNLEDTDISKASNELQAFWAPFLLMHLGGPDTITAYSLEDNELWLRHFLWFVVQVGLAFYVFLQSWSNNALTFLTIPLLISGIIKFGERTFVLRSSSTGQLKESLLSSPDPGPDVTSIEETGTEEREAVARVITHENIEREAVERVVPHENIGSQANYLIAEAYFLFNRFIFLFSDLILGYYERTESYSRIQNKSAKDAFDLVSIELGFLYDKLYTKATIVYSRLGIFFRCISVIFSGSVFVVFSLIIDMHAYSVTDLAITYFLLVWAVVLDVYSLISLLFSDWTRLWTRLWCMLRTKEPSYCTTFCSANNKKWSGSMAQHNLINFCLKNRSASTSIGVFINKLLEKYRNLTWEDVNDDLLKFIFTQVLEKGKQIKGDLFSIELCKKLLVQRGDSALEKRSCLNEFRWSTTKIEFDHSLLLWHIATDLCFYYDFDSHRSTSNLYSKCKISKCLSDYMLYLLVFCPYMLPKGIGELRYRDTCAEAKRLFWQKLSNKRSEAACKLLMEVKPISNDQLKDLKGEKTQSVLFYARNLAKQLQQFMSQDGRSYEEKWDMISEVWMEMLMYAANGCQWKQHGQQLRKGGELLTHVRVLMVHVGLSEQYQIQKQLIFRFPEEMVDERIYSAPRGRLSKSDPITGYSRLPGGDGGRANQRGWWTSEPEEMVDERPLGRLSKSDPITGYSRLPGGDGGRANQRGWWTSELEEMVDGRARRFVEQFHQERELLRIRRQYMGRGCSEL